MFDPYLEFLRSELRPYFGSRTRKPWRQQWREMRAAWAKYHCFPYHYLKHRLYERSARADWLDFLPAKLVRRFRFDHNPRDRLDMLMDKVETTRIVSAAGGRCVETLISIDTDGTIRQGDGSLTSAESASGMLRDAADRLFIKPIDAHAGRGASIIAAAELDPSRVNSLRNVVIQPVLRNHEVIAALHPGSLNTLRLGSLIEAGQPTIFAACLRVGRGNAVIDNYSQGGIAVGVNLADGTLHRAGITKGTYGRGVFERHPDSGIEFASVTLPWWRETLELATLAALALLPHITLGLDIAITPLGPVFIEANEGADIFFLQDAFGPLGTSVFGRRVLDYWLKVRRKG